MSDVLTALVVLFAIGVSVLGPLAVVAFIVWVIWRA